MRTHHARRTAGILCLIAILLISGLSLAKQPEVKVKDVRTQVDKNLVAYPQLEGMADPALQQAINDDIVLRGGIAKHLITLSLLQKEGLGLVVDYQTFLQKDVFSVVLNAKGKMPNGREGQAYVALCYHLQTGKPITAKDLFLDVPAAQTFMEERLETTLSQELSGYLEHSELAPLPIENMGLDEDGVTFYYPMDQFSLLSGYCGAGQFYYEELADFLNWDGPASSILTRSEALGPAKAKEAIAQMVESGRMPHVPVAIGDPMPDVVAKYRLLREPDQFPAGKYYQMETPMFRQVLVLSDALTGGYNHSVVEGLQSMRANLFGIQTGVTTRQQWQEILGKPAQQATFDESLAYDYGIPPGQSDFYTFGSYQLRLHADETGVLHSIRISK